MRKLVISFDSADDAGNAGPYHTLWAESKFGNEVWTVFTATDVAVEIVETGCGCTVRLTSMGHRAGLAGDR